MRRYVSRSKIRKNLDSNEDKNDAKCDDSDGNNNDDNSGGDDEDGGGASDDNDDGGNNFLFTGRNAIDLGLPFSPFTGETTFAYCTQDDNHACRDTDLGIRTIRKYFTREIDK